MDSFLGATTIYFRERESHCWHLACLEIRAEESRNRGNTVNLACPFARHDIGTNCDYLSKVTGPGQIDQFFMQRTMRFLSGVSSLSIPHENPSRFISPGPRAVLRPLKELNRCMHRDVEYR